MAGADPAACLGVPRPAVLARASGSSTVRMLARSAWQAHSAVRVTIAASSTLTVSVLPVFLVGALAGPIGADLGFGSAGTGLAITAFFAAGAVTAVPMGRLTERLGATVTMRAGVALSGSTTLAIGLLVDAWWHLAALLALAGCSVGLADTGGARSFADAIRTGRHGLAFAAKEASVPAASMLAGFSIPLLAERFGWTWAFVVGACLAPVVVLLIPPAARTGRHEEPVDAAAGRPKALMWLAIGVAVAAAASNAAATLFVPAMTDVGWSAGSAGALLALASIVTMGTRLVLGWASDQAPAATWWHLAGAISLGAVGAGLLAGASAGPLIPRWNHPRPRRGLGMERPRVPERGARRASHARCGRRGRPHQPRRGWSVRTRRIRAHRRARLLHRVLGDLRGGVCRGRNPDRVQRSRSPVRRDWPVTCGASEPTVSHLRWHVPPEVPVGGTTYRPLDIADPWASAAGPIGASDGIREPA